MNTVFASVKPPASRVTHTPDATPTTTHDNKHTHATATAAAAPHPPRQQQQPQQQPSVAHDSSNDDDAASKDVQLGAHLRVPLCHTTSNSNNSNNGDSKHSSMHDVAHDAIDSASTDVLDVSLQASVINSISHAYASSGYPTVITSGAARGTVYGAFVDLRNPSISCLNLPPRESVIVAPCSYDDDDNDHNDDDDYHHRGGSGRRAHTAAFDVDDSYRAHAQHDDGDNNNNNDDDDDATPTMDTLLKVMWKRGAGLFTVKAGEYACNAPPTSSAPPASSTAVNNNNNNNNSAAAGNAAPPPPPRGAALFAQYLQQYPTGIHGVVSSPNLRSILLHGVLPTGDTTDAPPPPPSSSAAAKNNNNNNNSDNAPPPPLPPLSNCPVQHTLVAASTFNHLTLYVVVHQDGHILYTAPLQTLQTSLCNRKVTAQRLFMMGWEEATTATTTTTTTTSAAGGMATAQAPEYYDLSAMTSHHGSDGSSDGSSNSNNGSNNNSERSSSSERGGAATWCATHERPEVLFRDVAVVEEACGGGLLLATRRRSGAPRYRGVDVARATMRVAVVGAVLQPLLLIGNQNGDLMVFDILAGCVVQCLNYGANNNTTGHHNNSNNNNSNSHSHHTVSGGGGGYTGKLITSPVTAIVEVQNGIEKKLATMTQYAAAAKRNGHRGFRVAERAMRYNNSSSSSSRSGAASGGGSGRYSFYSFSPSLFAASFDSGEVLLLGFTVESGGWVMRLFDQSYFGLWPIMSIAVRVPDFFVRVWTALVPHDVGRRGGSCSSSSNSSGSSGSTPLVDAVTTTTTTTTTSPTVVVTTYKHTSGAAAHDKSRRAGSQCASSPSSSSSSGSGSSGDNNNNNSSSSGRRGSMASSSSSPQNHHPLTPPPLPPRRVRAQTQRRPRSTLVSLDTALFIYDAEQAHMAAIACNHGTIVLVRLPGFEKLTTVSVYAYNAVGNLLALTWTARTPATLLTPDVLLASGEDDSLTAFQLVATPRALPYDGEGGDAGGGGTSSSGSYHQQQNNNNHNNSDGLRYSSSSASLRHRPSLSSSFTAGARGGGGGGGVGGSSSVDEMAFAALATRPYASNGSGTWTTTTAAATVACRYVLRVLEKKQYHRSWMNDLATLPLVLPAASSCNVTGHLPCILGTCVLASAYDGRTSFWPIRFRGQADEGEPQHAAAATTTTTTAATTMTALATTAHEHEDYALHTPVSHSLLLAHDAAVASDDGLLSASASAMRMSLPQQQQQREQQQQQRMLHNDAAMTTAATACVPPNYLILHGPTAAHVLDRDHTLRVGVAGGGTSFVMASLCCRGRVRVWALRVEPAALHT